MAQKNRISETEWKQLLPQMASFAHITTDIGYSVLVKGEKSSASRPFQAKHFQHR